MKFSVSALLAVACASAASATTISVVTPWASTVWTSGGVGNITWTTSSTGGTALTTCSIDMLGGSSTNAEIVAHVTATPIDCTAGKFEITPLGDFASGQYWLRIGAEPNWFYSGKFQFTGKGTVGAVSAAWNASSAAVMPTASVSMASGASPMATASGSGKSVMAGASNSLNPSASASASGKTSGSSNVQASLVAASVAAVGAVVAALM